MFLLRFCQRIQQLHISKKNFIHHCSSIYSIGICLPTRLKIMFILSERSLSTLSAKTIVLNLKEETVHTVQQRDYPHCQKERVNICSVKSLFIPLEMVFPSGWWIFYCSTVRNKSCFKESANKIRKIKMFCWKTPVRMCPHCSKVSFKNSRIVNYMVTFVPVALVWLRVGAGVATREMLTFSRVFQRVTKDGSERLSSRLSG